MRIGTTKANVYNHSELNNNAEERKMNVQRKKCVLITVVIIKTAVSSLLFRRLVVMLIFQCVFLCVLVLGVFANNVSF